MFIVSPFILARVYYLQLVVLIPGKTSIIMLAAAKLDHSSSFQIESSFDFKQCT